MKKIGPFKINSIIKGDCIELLKNIPDNSIDLIFADPPYNLQLNGELYRPDQSKVNAVKDKWDKFSSFADYDKFTKSWLTECHRVLKKSGCIWVIGSYHNIFRVGSILQDIGFWILNDIVWIKSNPMPNFKGTRFNNAHETLIWAAKNKNSDYTFHYHSMKVMNDDKQMRSEWTIPLCTGNERIKLNNKKVHSTQKPVGLLFRIIISSSSVNDIILDPFMGSGTTGAAAIKLGRNFIGFEKNEQYIKVAVNRISKIKPIRQDLLDYKTDIKKPKVPFGCLLEKGFIIPGEFLFSEDSKFKAEVQADSSVSSGQLTGSIHKVSSSLLKKENYNGWSFWYVKRRNKLVSIDTFRYEYEKKYLKSSQNP